MKVLGIDTATDILGIALTEDRKLITEYRSNFKRAHAEKLINSIDQVLKDANLSLQDLDGIAISIGPGSFTGLRIGLSSVKGLAFSTQIPIVAVNTLDALAHQALYWNYQICPLIHAQADEAYTALYRVNKFLLERISEYRLITLGELNHLISEKTLILNNGMKNLPEYIAHFDQGQFIIAPEELSYLSGLTIAQLGYDKLQKGEVEDIETLEPYYLKEFKAKQKSEPKF